MKYHFQYEVKTTNSFRNKCGVKITVPIHFYTRTATILNKQIKKISLPMFTSTVFKHCINAIITPFKKVNQAI